MPAVRCLGSAACRASGESKPRPPIGWLGIGTETELPLLIRLFSLSGAGLAGRIDNVFDTLDPELASWLADVPEPDWAEHPVYSSMIPASERLGQLMELAPAARPTGELAVLDPRALSAADRIDLVTALQEQKNWIDAVQARVLAEIDAADTGSLGLSQEAVSLALKVPLRTAQRMLKTGRTLWPSCRGPWRSWPVARSRSGTRS